MVGADAFCDRKQSMQEQLAFGALVWRASQQRIVHEPVGTECWRGNAMLPFHGIEFDKACFGEDGVYVFAEGVDDPLDIVDAGSLCIGELVVPAFTRKRLNTTGLGRYQ